VLLQIKPGGPTTKLTQLTHRSTCEYRKVSGLDSSVDGLYLHVEDQTRKWT
jgi:hypothetical protein